jgi:hypothetical protein
VKDKQKGNTERKIEEGRREEHNTAANMATQKS